MRSKVKSWQDRRPGWTRRVSWYEGDSTVRPIRLSFEDTNGRANRFYDDYATAQRDYNAFINGELTVLLVQERTVFS